MGVQRLELLNRFDKIKWFNRFKRFNRLGLIIQNMIQLLKPIEFNELFEQKTIGIS